jgi:CHAT domain-containing protein/tetratricopeptide (TPR) repeat protein
LSISSKIFLTTLSLFTFCLLFCFVDAQYIYISEDSLILRKAQLFFESGKYDSSALFYEKYLTMERTSRYLLSGMPDQKSRVDKGRFLKVSLNLGTSYNMISKPEDALPVLTYGLKVAESDSFNDPLIKALLFYQTGNAYLLKMEFINSIRSYQNALALVQHDDALAMKINQNLGGIFFFMEDYDKAIEHYQKALVIKSGIRPGDPVKTAELLINTGSAYVEKNEFIKATEYFSKAEMLFQGINKTDMRKFARLSVSLGNLLVKMNRQNEAYDQFVKAFHLYHLDMPVNPDEIILLHANMGQLYKSQLNLDSTIHYFNVAASLIPDNSERYLIVHADLYRSIGETYGIQKDWSTAIRYFQKAEEMLIRSDSDSLTSSVPGLKNSLIIPELFRIRKAKAYALFMSGLTKASDDIILQSFNEYLSAVGSVNMINMELGREGSKLLFNESIKDLYYGALEAGYYISTHNQKERAEELFLINEKSRNKILLSGFMDHIAKRVAGIPDSLLIKDKMLNDEISLCLRNLFINQPVNLMEQQDNYRFYLNKLIDSRHQLDSLQIQYEHSSVVYRNIKEQETVTDLSEIQRQLLPEEALLEYFIGDTSIFIFVVTSDSLIIKRIPVSGSINNEISKFNKEIRLAEQQHIYESGHGLYRKLILPVKSSLIHVKKLIIIPDENLATIPFEALISEFDPSRVSSFDHPSYLINDFEISYQFSSALWIRSLRKDRIHSDSLSYAGFAPINFSSEKKGFSTSTINISFSSLPFSEHEIKDISDLIRKSGGNTDLFCNHEATEKNLRNNLGFHSMVHIATHSLINEDHPELSGLVFFQDLNERKSNSVFEGILYLEEIFNFSINPDLLILSACATGTGKITRSEGVLAMTRGFFTAGASNIVYTLWNVSDKHTRDVMVSFFKGILEGQTYSGALRHAKIEMISKPETSLPRLWAPYVLLGR